MGMFAGVISRPLVRWLTHLRRPRAIPLSDFERIRYELRPCDILLVEGRSQVSDVIRMVTQSPWTHAALYIGRIHDVEDRALRELIRQHAEVASDEQLIVESQLGLGTVICPLSKYKDDHVRICRPKGINIHDAQRIVAYAIHRLGVPYNVRQIFDLFRFLFPWFILPRRWRSSLFQHNPGLPTRTVCSTMIAEAFGEVQFPILPLVRVSQKGEAVKLYRRNPQLCTPSDFDYSPYFEIIKYPFVDFAAHSSYRLLPWSGPGSGSTSSDKDEDSGLSAEEAQMYIDTTAETGTGSQSRD